MAAEDHGHTAAAWTTVLVILLGIVIGALAVVLQNWTLFWVGGLGLVIIGGVVGKIMQMMGMGKPAETKAAQAGVPVEEHDG